MIRLQIREPVGIKSDDLKGILLSLITAIEEVATRHRKASFLVHFFQERLDRSERRMLISVLNQLQSQLHEIEESLFEEAEILTGNPLPSRARSILDKLASYGKI